MNRKMFFTLLLTACSLSLFAQNRVVVGKKGQTNPDARLELTNPSETADAGGLLLPYVKLSSTASPAPLTKGSATAHTSLKGMVVYNTATAADVKPGIYYNDGTKWVAVSNLDPATLTNFWKTTGNAGTTPATNFLGTTDAAPLNLRTNNKPVMLIPAATGYADTASLYVGQQSMAAGIKNSNSRSNTVIGAGALGFGSADPAATYSNNVVVGSSAGKALQSSSANVFVGFKAGSTQSNGSNNIAVGANTELPSLSASNQMNVGNTIFGKDMTGTPAAPAGSIGIKKSIPEATLHVGGNLKIDNVSKAAATAQNLMWDPVTKEVQATTSTTKLFYSIDYKINTGQGDWVKEFDTKIPTANHIVIVTSATFTRTNGGAAPVTNYHSPTPGAGLDPASVPSVVFPSQLGGTWRLNADYDSVGPHYNNPQFDNYEWRITILVINKSMVEILPTVSSGAYQDTGAGSAGSNPLPQP